MLTAVPPGPLGTPGQALALLQASDPSIPINNPVQVVAFVLPSLTFGLRSADNSGPLVAPAFPQCTPVSALRFATLQFSELFQTAVKPRTSAPYVGPDVSPPPQSQTVPGFIYNAETGFYNPALGGTGALAGLADFGTRVRVAFNNVPPGVMLWVSTAAVSFSGGMPVPSTGSQARLVGIEAGAFVPVAPTATLDGIPAAQLVPVSGSATAVWEILKTDPLVSEKFNFPVWIAYTAAALGTATVNGNLAPAPPAFPLPAGASAQDASFPLPRFLDVSTAGNLLTINACSGLSISGTITLLGSGLAGVTVSLGSVSTLTDPAGHYAFNGLAPGGTYTVTPSTSGYAFLPASQTFSNLAVNQTANFTALPFYTISGQVTNALIGLNGVAVTLSGSQTGSTNTNFLGSYTFTVPAGGTYSVMPARIGYVFSPTSQTFNNLSGNQTANFAATVNVSKTGVFHMGTWFLDVNGSNIWDAGDRAFGWGTATSVPVVGDWNGDGHTKVGVFDNGVWYLDYNGSGVFDAGDRIIAWGRAGDVPVVGDWNGDKRSKIGVYRSGTWFLDYVGNGDFNTRLTAAWGDGASVPVVGDWNGSGSTKIGVFKQGVWYLDANGNSVFDAGDRVIAWGTSTSVPVTGDWTGTGSTKIGVFDQGLWALDMNGSSVFDAGDRIFIWGTAAATPLVGDWNGDGKIKIGVFLLGNWYLDMNGDAVFNTGDRAFGWGGPGDQPLIGRW